MIDDKWDQLEELLGEATYEDFVAERRTKEPIYLNEEMFAFLLLKGVVFINSRKYLDLEEKPQKETIVAFVLCSDTFAPCCADAEEVTTTELPELFEMYMKDTSYGPTKWACKKRGKRPM